VEATYQGPSDVLEFPGGSGKYYRKGDKMQIGKDDRAALEMGGHFFTDTDHQAVAELVATRVQEQSQPLAQPFDDRGQQLTVPENKHTAVDAPAPAAQPASPKAAADTK
jgi:hypothetical protein